jgi:nucleotide-binding universal stress UspA family protein
MPVILVRPEETVEVDLSNYSTFSNVLVSLDGSANAEQTIPWAKMIGGSNAVYTLVRVVPNSFPAWSPLLKHSGTEAPDYAELGRGEATHYLDSLEKALREEGLDAGCSVEEGVPVAVGILKAAEQRSADLIAITTHARAGLPRLVLGSVADKVVRASHVPVLVVRPKKP